MFTAITLHGALAQHASKATWKLSVKSVGEALRAIEMNSRRKGKSIFKYFFEHEKGMAEYRIVIDGQDFTCTEELVLPLKHFTTIDIIPVPQGSGNAGLWEVILGVVLVVVGVVLVASGIGAPGGAAVLGLSASFWASLSTALILNGIALAIGGLLQLINPPSAVEAAKNKPSYLFGGMVNSVDQGGPVPVGWGQLIVGSQVISSFVTTVPFGTVIANAGETQTNTGSFTNPITTNSNVAALLPNAEEEPESELP